MGGVLLFANVAGLDARLTGFISAAQIRRLDTYRGRVYDIKADSNSCRRA
jgi:hypothetical protein